MMTMMLIDSLRRSGRGLSAPRVRAALRDWTDNMGILARYALGLDLYDRGEVARPQRNAGIAF